VVGNRIPLTVERYHPEDGASVWAQALGAPLREAQPPARVALQAVPWAALIGPAPGGVVGAFPESAVRVFTLPGTPRQLRGGQAEPTTWMVWDGPHLAVPITPAAAAVLQLTAGTRDIEDIAEILAVAPGILVPLLDSLARIGAFKIQDPEVDLREDGEGAD
jgi:hypothetical protein